MLKISEDLANDLISLLWRIDVDQGADLRNRTRAVELVQEIKNAVISEAAEAKENGYVQLGGLGSVEFIDPTRDGVEKALMADVLAARSAIDRATAVNSLAIFLDAVKDTDRADASAERQSRDILENLAKWPPGTIVVRGKP